MLAPRARMEVNASWPGGIQEGDEAVVDLDLICTDGLSDAAGLACGDVGLADSVQDTGLAVVNVAHDADDRGTGDEIVLRILLLGEQALLDGDVDFLLDLGVELLGHQSGGIEIDDVVDGVHLAICMNLAMTLPACCFRRQPAHRR